MAVTKTGERKLVFFDFNVDGHFASISASKVNPDGSHGDVIEKKEVKNIVNPHFNKAVAFVTFPEGYTGKAFIVVQGSKPGSAPDEGTVSA
jgi:hypothetical protein